MLWNLPYRPDLNGIEHYWALTKQKFRADLLQAMMKGVEYDLRKVVMDVFPQISHTAAKACAVKGERMLRLELG